MEQYVQAEACVEVLNSYGVEYIFFNPGIDTVPLQVAVSRFKALGKKAPGLVLCLDEAVAMAAAHGHYMVSGRPQVVMVHSELGTLQGEAPLPTHSAAGYLSSFVPGYNLQPGGKTGVKSPMTRGR